MADEPPVPPPPGLPAGLPPPPTPPDDEDEAGGGGDREEDMATLQAMGFERPQCELALAFARGNVEGALQVLLNPEIMELFTAGLMGGGGLGRGRGGSARGRLAALSEARSLGGSPAARPPLGTPRDVEVTEAAMGALMEMGYPPVRCSKSLFQTGGDVERAAMFMLEHSEEPDEFWIFSPDDLAWAIETRQAGLEHQLEMLCSRPDLLLSGSGQVQVQASLLQLLQVRPVSAAHPWACRAINAFGDRDILFRSTVRRVLMDCLGVDADPEKALSSDSLDNAVVITLQRIFLDPDFHPRPRDHVVMVEKLLTLVGNFCTAHPRSKLPAACETAMEFCKSLLEKPDTAVLREHPRETDAVVDAVSAMLCQEDGGSMVRQGALQCVGSIISVHDWSREGEEMFNRLVTSRRKRLPKLLLRLLLERPSVGSKVDDDVYGLTCAVLSSLCVSSPRVLEELCETQPARNFGAAGQETSGIRSDDCASTTHDGDQPEPELVPEPELQPGQEVPEHRSSAAALSTREFSGSLHESDIFFIDSAGGGILGTVVLALRNGCGDDLCGLVETLITVLFDGYAEACAELTQRGGPFYVGDAVQGRDTQDAGTGEYMPGTVLSDNADGTYDVQWESGGNPTTFLASQLRRANYAVSSGSPRGVADLLSQAPLHDVGRAPARTGISRQLLQRRDQLVRAVLPALLMAHHRKSSVHQKFLSVLIATLEKANRSSLPPPTSARAQHAAVTLESITDDVELLDARTVIGHDRTFGTVIANTASPKQKGKWYYEVKIGGSSYGQIGFAVNTFVVTTGSGDGVGDDGFSWAYDGWRQKTWNRAIGEGHSDYATEVKWSAGAVIGCLLDLDEGQISFSLNGDVLGVAFTNVKSQLAAAMRDEGALGICPAATFTAGRHELRFSEQECEFTPAGYQHYVQPTNAFTLRNDRVDDCSQYPELAPDGTPNTTVVTVAREADAPDQSDCVIRAEYPLVGLAVGEQFDSTASGYFEATIVAEGDDGSEGVDVSVGLAKHTTVPSRVLGCEIDSIGYQGSACLLWGGVGAEQLLPGDEQLELPQFVSGDTIGCGVLQAPSPAESQQPGTGAASEPVVQFLRVFWTKNGELVCVSADIIPALDDWYPAITMGRAGQRVTGNFAGPFQFDLSAFLAVELADAPAVTEVTLSTVEDENFAPHLMRTTREMLQSDSLTSLLMALRLITVVLQWEVQSYALLRRQDVVRRVHALACGEMPQSIQSQPRPKAVVQQHAAVVLSVIDHVADGEPPDAQLDYFCGLADRIRAGQLAAPADSTILSAICGPVESQASEATGVAAIKELVTVMDSSDGITEFEFEQANMAGALLHFIDHVADGLEQLRALFGSDVNQVQSGVGPRHFRRLIQMLQGVVACTDTLPVYHVPSDMRGAGSGMSCLLNPLRVAFTSDASLPVNCKPLSIGIGRDTHEAQEKELIGMFEPITPIVELEAFIRRSVICTDPRFVDYCCKLVGCRVEEHADGLDGWRGAHVVGFDQTTGRHSLLYENGNGDAPLVWRLMSSRTYRIRRGRCVSSREALSAEREFKKGADKREQEDAKKLAKKKKSWWGRKTSGLAGMAAEPQWVPLRGMRVGVKPTVTRVWEPAIVLSADSDHIQVIRDHAPHPEPVRHDQVLQLDSPTHGDAPEVQWQWFDGQWWSFSVEESQNLEAARANPDQVRVDVHLHGTRHVVDFRSMSKRNSVTGVESPVRRISTCDLWRELAPEGERAVSDRQELSNIARSDTTMGMAGGDADAVAGCVGADRQGAVESNDMPSLLALRVRCRFGGFTMPGKAGQLVGHRQHQSDLRDAGLGDLPSSMTVFQCLMKATDMLDIVSEDGQRSSSRTLMPWQCSFSMVYRLEVVDTMTGLPVPSDYKSLVDPPAHHAGADIAANTTQVVVVYENQRCPWTPFGDPKAEKFSSTALLRNDRHAWSDAAGAALPSPQTDPLPPNGWVWRGAWYEGSDWEYAYDWESEWSTGGPGPKSWVRRRRWERQLEDLAAPAPEPASGPMQTTPPIEPVPSTAPELAPRAEGSTEMVRNLQQQANSPFITRWGLGGSPDAVASRLGDKRVAQAMRDLHGDSFVLDGPMSPPRHVDEQGNSSAEERDGEGGAVPLPPDRPSTGLHRRVFSTLNLPEIGLSGAEEERERDNRKWARALRGSGRAFKDSLRVLAHLYRDTVLRTHAAPTDWLSSKLGFKLRDQLSDPLTLVSGALPEWCECLMFGARFLFPFDLRQLFFRCTAFGPARAVAWLKLQQPRAFDPVSALKVDRWLIKRKNFLEQAYTLMSHHAKRKTALQVEFEGPLESGIGSGVHVSFFTDAAARLESWADNVDLALGCGMPMWVIDSEARGSGDTSSEQLLCELYPHSLLGIASQGTADAVCRRFQLLGWLFAKALLDQQMDERLLPLRLSPHFLDLALGRLRLDVEEGEPESEHAGVAEIGNLEDLPFVELASSFIKGGTQVQMLHKLWLQFERGELSEADVDSTLEDLCVAFVDPATGGIVMPATGAPLEEISLCDDGTERMLQATTLREYFTRLAHSWFGEGVGRQVAAFTDAMNQVLPVSKLLVFTTSELLESVCGEAVQWDEETVRDCIIPGEGYTSTDPPYQWLLLEVVSMGPSARKDFLKFVTARVRLPSGGLRALSRKVEIRRSAADVSTVPHGHTCALALDLPAYSSQTELHVMLYKALELMNRYDTGLYD